MILLDFIFNQIKRFVEVVEETNRLTVPSSHPVTNNTIKKNLKDI